MSPATPAPGSDAASAPGAAASAPANGRFALSDADRANVRVGFEVGRQSCPNLALAADRFEARVGELGARHWRAQGLDPTPERLSAFVAGAALADVYLATACEAGDPTAWKQLTERYRLRLEGFAVRRGSTSAAAESAVADLLGDLVMPTPRGGGRSLLASFDGTGSLIGWLSIVLLRRIGASAKAKKTVSLDSLDASPSDETPYLSPSERAPEPASAAETAEAAAVFSAALNRAWLTLSPQERFVLVLKHRDEWSQRRIGDALGVGEPRVSRVVSAAIGKLTAALQGVYDSARGDSADALRQAFAGVLARRLASSGPPDAPTRRAADSSDPASGASPSRSSVARPGAPPRPTPPPPNKGTR